MNELSIFENPEFGSIRTTMIDDEPWFVGKDVATALGYKNSRDAITKHVDDEDKEIIQKSQNATLDFISNRGLTIINESGLYCLILSSKLPSAKKFKRWVTSEVLPAIRKTGTYTMIQTQSNLTKDDFLKAALIVSRCKNDRLPYVLNFLEGAGFSVPELRNTQVITNCSVMNESVVGFLNCFDDFEIENVPTRVIYSQYRNYCDENNLSALCSGEFSKQMKQILDMSIISKKIQGKVYRIFIKK